MCAYMFPNLGLPLAHDLALTVESVVSCLNIVSLHDSCPALVPLQNNQVGTYTRTYMYMYVLPNLGPPP